MQCVFVCECAWDTKREKEKANTKVTILNKVSTPGDSNAHHTEKPTYSRPVFKIEKLMKNYEKTTVPVSDI